MIISPHPVTTITNTFTGVWLTSFTLLPGQYAVAATQPYNGLHALSVKPASLRITREQIAPLSAVISVELIRQAGLVSPVPAGTLLRRMTVNSPFPDAPVTLEALFTGNAPRLQITDVRAKQLSDKVFGNAYATAMSLLGAIMVSPH